MRYKINEFRIFAFIPSKGSVVEFSRWDTSLASRKIHTLDFFNISNRARHLFLMLIGFYLFVFGIFGLLKTHNILFVFQVFLSFGILYYTLFNYICRFNKIFDYLSIKNNQIVFSTKTNHKYIKLDFDEITKIFINDEKIHFYVTDRYLYLIVIECQEAFIENDFVQEEFSDIAYSELFDLN